MKSVTSLFLLLPYVVALLIASACVYLTDRIRFRFRPDMPQPIQSEDYFTWARLRSGEDLREWTAGSMPATRSARTAARRNSHKGIRLVGSFWRLARSSESGRLTGPLLETTKLRGVAE